MSLVKNTVLILTTAFTLILGSFPPGSVICQAVDGRVIIESSCDCESEVPPCCDDDECHEEKVVEHKHNQTLSPSNECVDTIISVDHYTEQKAFIIKNKFLSAISLDEFITLIAGLDYPIDTGGIYHSDPPPLPSSNLNIINTTVLII